MARSGYIVILINLWKRSRTSFQAATLSQKHVISISHTAHYYWPNFFGQYLGFKKNGQKRNFPYVEMKMMMSQISKSVDFTRAQKSRYLMDKIIFFLQIKKFINYTSRVNLLQKNSFLAEVIIFKLGIIIFEKKLFSFLKFWGKIAICLDSNTKFQS